jgi:ribonucleoside-diphosphate reductase alpha chain
MKIVNESVPGALRKLGYGESDVKNILEWITAHGTVEGAPHFRSEHLAIFDCAVKPAEGTRFISWQGHVRLVAAVQPFISGAISKTFNMPSEVTKEEIADAYMMAWRLGIKAFAVYRDGSKATQPLESAHKKSAPGVQQVDGILRRRLPATRNSETHKFSIGGHEGYLTYSMFEDGALAEIFIRVAKQGSTLAGLLDSFAIAVSMALQYGVPLKALAQKFIHSRFEPSGFTKNQDIQVATSIVDYIFRYLSLRFLSHDDLDEFGMNGHAAPIATETEPAAPMKINSPKLINGYTSAGTVCKLCGGMMFRTGSCLTCLSCGSSNGGCS